MADRRPGPQPGRFDPGGTEDSPWVILALVATALIVQVVLVAIPVPAVVPLAHVMVTGVVLLLAARSLPGFSRSGRKPATPPPPPLGRSRPGWNPEGKLFSVEPLIGRRRWVIVPGERVEGGMPIPYLSSPVFPTVWNGPELTARCSSSVNIHPRDRVPTLECSCGIYAFNHEPPDPEPGRLMVTGSVALSGTVLEGTEGYRASRAKVQGPLRVFLGAERPARSRRVFGWARGGNGSTATEVWLIDDRLLPVAPDDPPVTAPDGRWPIEEFAEHVRSWLEVRYGVEVELEKGAR